MSKKKKLTCPCCGRKVDMLHPCNEALKCCDLCLDGFVEHDIENAQAMNAEENAKFYDNVDYNGAEFYE